MIRTLEIQNFKCFAELKLQFGQLTLLTGFNGGGKSSAIQPLLLLSQGLRETAAGTGFPLNGSRVRLGTVADVLPSYDAQPTICLKVSHSKTELTWSFTPKTSDRALSLDGFEGEGSDREGLERALITLIYVSAVREGTADGYPIPDVKHHAIAEVGTDGCFAAYWYDQFVDEEVQAPRLHPKEAATSVRKQLDAWIGTLFPGAQADVQMVPQLSLLSLRFRLSDTGAWRRPANIGYGLTYAFPILVALLVAAEGQVVVIDSPEAHLHPYAQSQMGKILAHFAASGVQIIVETHSDHLLNGVRLAAKDKVLSNAALKLHFFTGATKEGHGVTSPQIDSEGRIDEWPEGFFDQSEKDLSRLAGW